MDPFQSELLKILIEISHNLNKPYTITGASDWAIITVFGGALFTAFVSMWYDLKSTIKDHRGEWRQTIDKFKEETEKEQCRIWSAFDDCQKECCPRGKNKQ